MKETLQSTSLDIWETKYQLKGKDGIPIDLNVDDTYKRVAKALASVELHPENWEDRFYWALCNGAIPAGRIVSNVGGEQFKPNTSTINCTVSDTIKDSMLGIMDTVKEAGLTLAAGCGIGYDFSTLRPKGAFVAGVGAQTSGTLSFMNIYDAMCFTVASAGGRRGAQMGTMCISHPDVEDFIKAKREDGRLRQFNLSLLITDDFMKAVKEDLDWQLTFPKNRKESAEHTVLKPWPYVGDNMETVDGLVVHKVYRTVKARELWDLIMKSTYNYAEPGFILIDEVNKMNNLWWCEEIRATNPSLSKGTLVHTKGGFFPIEQLEGKEFEVRAIDGSWGRARCWLSSEKAAVAKVTLGAYQEYVATLEHKWPVVDKLTGRLRKVTTADLKAGDKIPKNSVLLPEVLANNSLTREDGLFLGVWLADGHLSKTSSGGYNLGISFNKLDRGLAEVILSYVNKFKHRPSSISTNDDELTIQVSCSQFIDRAITLLGIHSGPRKFPEIIWKSNDEFILGFLDGFISGDGYVAGDGKQRIMVRQKEKEVILGVAKLLSFLGVTGSIRHSTQPSTFPNGKDYGKRYSCYTLTIGKIASKKLGTFLSLSCDRKEAKFSEIRNCDILKGAEEDLYNTVESVNLLTEGVPVWDVAVDHFQHLFPIQWGYTGNCGEQPLPPYGACLLGSINLTKFVKNPFSKDAEFDWHLYSAVIRTFTRMLDNVVEMNGLPLPQQVAEIVRKRRHGMGFLGLGSAMTMMKMKYGSEESIVFAKRAARTLAIEGWKEGVKLAIEKGPAPIMLEEFEHKGHIVLGKDLFAQSEYLARVVPESVLSDIRKYGCRFTHHTSIAPTGTISLSLANNASNGIEPSFSHEYQRNVIKEGEKTKRAVPVYSYEAWLWKRISPQLPYPDYFSTSDSISPEDHVAVQAAVQKYIDSAISKTVNVPKDIPFEDFKNVYMQAYDSGLKGCTTFRFNPDAFQGVLVTKKDLQDTIYEFKTETGETVELRGDEEVEYDGAVHTAANLFDSLKEGYYGKF